MKAIEEIIYEVYRQSRLKEQELKHKDYSEVLSEALSQIQELVEREVIGEDEVRQYPDDDFTGRMVRNGFRNQQRTNLKAIMRSSDD